MAKTYSTMLELGSKAIPFTLPNHNPSLAAETFSVADSITGKGLLLLFICNHCPYVVHIAKRLAEVANEAQNQGLQVLAINANDIKHYPADSPAKMALFSREYGFEFPYLFDAEQSVAKAYQAACTPDLFLFDSQLQLVYRGQFDGARPGNQTPVTGEDLQAAIQALLGDKPPLVDQIASMGCNIKWLAGNEPDYF